MNQGDNPFFPVALAGILLALEMGLDLGPAFAGITASHDVIMKALHFGLSQDSRPCRQP